MRQFGNTVFSPWLQGNRKYSSGITVKFRAANCVTVRKGIPPHPKQASLPMRGHAVSWLPSQRYQELVELAL
jgi:hypothetical protein